MTEAVICYWKELKISFLDLCLLKMKMQKMQKLANVKDTILNYKYQMIYHSLDFHGKFSDKKAIFSERRSIERARAHKDTILANLWEKVTLNHKYRITSNNSRGNYHFLTFFPVGIIRGRE